MRLLDLFSRTAFALASLMLMLLAGALVAYGGSQVWEAYWQPEADSGSALLEAVGYTIIAIAVFDVGKYLFEEEAVRAREMRQAGEARRSLTKFLSTIAIAVFLEALVAVFEASKTDVSTMIYPTFLLFGGVALVVGLGVFQRLSAAVEKTVGGARGETRDEEEAQQANKGVDTP